MTQDARRPVMPVAVLPSERNASCSSTAPREEIEMNDEESRVGVDAETS